MVKKNFLKSSLIVLAVLAIALIPTASVNASGVANKNVPALAYSAHVQSFGWMGTKNAGTSAKDTNTIAGTEGLSKRVEALRVSFEAPEGVTLKYNAHIQGKGWTGWTEITEDNQLIGTQGEAKRLEAIKFSVTGLEGYEIKYRAHVQTYGWQDWLTADASQSLAKIAGTQGESKRIESLQFLVLDTESAEVFDFRQEAIQQLKAYANANEFTMNKKLLAEALEEGIDGINDANADENSINDALNTAKGLVDDVMNDREIREAAEKINTYIDNWLTGAEFSVNKNWGAVETIVSEESEVASAIKVAKEGILKHDEYTLELMTYYNSSSGIKKNGEYANEALDTIREGMREYILRKANELYNATYEKDEHLYTKAQLDATYTAIKADEDGVLKELKETEKLTTADVKAALGTLKLTDSWTLQAEITKQKTALKATWDKAFKEVGIGGEKTSKYTAAKIVDVSFFKEVFYIKDAMEGMEEDLDKAQNYPQIMQKVDAYEAKVLSGLTTFVERLIAKLSVPNAVGILSKEDVKTIRDLLAEEEPNIETITKTVAQTLSKLAGGTGAIK